MDIYDEILGSTSRLDAQCTLGPVSYTYGDLIEASVQVARTLRQSGLRQGDRVELCFDVGFMFGAALLAMAAADAVGVLFSPQWTSQECHRVRNLSTPRFSLLPVGRTMANDPSTKPTPISETGIGLIVHPGEPAPCDPGDVMLIYTSGTSATPKGVVLTRKNLDTNIRGINEYLELSPEDRSPVFTPTAYAFAVSQALTHALAGAAVYPVPDGMSRPQAVTQAIAEDRLTGITGNPTGFKMLLTALSVAPRDLSSIRFVHLGGQFLEWDLVERLEAAFPNAQVINIYGCTENSPRIAFLSLPRGAPRGDTVYVPMGYPVKGTTFRITGEAGQTLPNGQVGEVTLAGGALMRGYWQNPAANEARLVNREFHTGDLGQIDEQGRLHLVGRESNIIRVGQNKVSPEEVEAVLMTHPDVEDAGVFGEPDELREEVVFAKVVLSQGRNADAGELIRYCLQRLSRFKVPRSIHFVPSLPRTMYGKTDRTRLREERVN